MIYGPKYTQSEKLDDYPRTNFILKITRSQMSECVRRIALRTFAALKE